MAGRLPPAGLAALLVAVAATALLPAGAATVVALALVIMLGVPHGALDGEVARALLRPRFGPWWFPVFSVPYLALSAAVLWAWHLAPLPTLAAFLAVSAWHFGQEDAGSGRPLEAVLRGGLPVALPVLLHPKATAAFLATVSGVPMAGAPPWLVLAAWAWLTAAVAAVAVLAAEGRRAVLVEVFGLVAIFAALPPLPAFAFYFVGFHAPRHMREAVAAPLTAPRLPTMRAAVLRAVPVTALTLLLGALLWPLYPGAAPDRLLCLTLQGLAALTLPHVLLTLHAETRDPLTPGR